QLGGGVPGQHLGGGGWGHPPGGVAGGHQLGGGVPGQHLGSVGGGHQLGHHPWDHGLDKWRHLYRYGFLATPYLLPRGYQGYGYGQSLVYGGSTYVVGDDGYMYQQAMTDQGVVVQTGGCVGQPYQVPAGYDATPGNVIEYGGATYVVCDDRNMYVQAAAEQTAVEQPTQVNSSTLLTVNELRQRPQVNQLPPLPSNVLPQVKTAVTLNVNKVVRPTAKVGPVTRKNVALRANQEVIGRTRELKKDSDKAGLCLGKADRSVLSMNSPSQLGQARTFDVSTPGSWDPKTHQWATMPPKPTVPASVGKPRVPPENTQGGPDPGLCPVPPEFVIFNNVVDTLQLFYFARDLFSLVRALPEAIALLKNPNLLKQISKLSAKAAGISEPIGKIFPRINSSPATFGKLEAEGFTAPKIGTNRHGQLTNGTYTLDEAGMQPHSTGSLANGKSQFMYRVNADQLALDAAAYADQKGLWVGNKAKVIFDRPIGVHADTGEPTSVLNIYRTSTGFIHAAPGRP